MSPYFPHVSRWYTSAFSFIFSLDWSLQLGLKQRERSIVKPVIVCTSNEQRDVCTGTDSYTSMDLFGQERDLGGCLKLVGREDKFGNRRCCCMTEGLVVELSGNTPYGLQVALFVLSCSQSRERGHDSIPMRSPRSS